MPIIRLLLLLGLAGGLFLLVQFNSSPLPLTFLGTQTPALPLAVWILGAIGAGIVTNLLITSLFNLSNYFAVRAARSQFRQPRRSGFQAPPAPSPPSQSYAPRSSTDRTADDDDADWNNWEGYEEPRQSSSARSTSARSTSARSPVDEDPLDDWETETNDDWAMDEPSDAPVDSRPPSRIRTDYEAKQEPKTTSRNGSVYSYSYSDPKDSGVGKAEPVLDKPVVDADYRVIVPPFRSLDEEPADPKPTAADRDDDWFEDADEEFEDRSTRRDRPRK